jgi:hypothetical protein
LSQANTWPSPVFVDEFDTGGFKGALKLYSRFI